MPKRYSQNLFFGKVGFLNFFKKYLFKRSSSNSTVSENFGIEPRTAATLALAIRGSAILLAFHK
jgi:hypothetical protein